MQAIIFADRRGAELSPLCDAQCPALLPVANRPLLHYTIEDLAEAGYRMEYLGKWHVSVLESPADRGWTEHYVTGARGAHHGVRW